MIYLGADPSLRHTGFVLVDSGSASVRFITINTLQLDVLSSVRMITREIKRFLGDIPVDPGVEFILTIERQLNLGWNAGGKYVSQIAVFDAVDSYFHPSKSWVLLPFPNQLKHYVRERHGVTNWKSKAAIVAAARSCMSGYAGPLTDHEADAYFLAHLGREVLSGVWSFRVPKKQATSMVPVTAIWRQRGE